MKLAAKYDERTDTPAAFAPVPSPPVLLIVRLLNSVEESTKYNCTPTASLSSKYASSIHAPVAFISIVAVASPGVFAPSPPVPTMLNPSIIAL